MSAQQQSPAIAIARAHVQAWSNYDFDNARGALAPDTNEHAQAMATRFGPGSSPQAGASVRRCEVRDVAATA